MSLGRSAIFSVLPSSRSQCYENSVRDLYVNLICLINENENEKPCADLTLKVAIMKMQGLSLTSLKKHPALYPLYFCIGLGGCGALWYTLRLATGNPDVSWLNKKEAEPWNDYKDKRYKFYATKDEFKNVKSPAPEY